MTPTLDGVVDDFDRMCFDATDLFPVGSVLSLKKGEVTTGAAVIAKTGDDGRRGEAEAGDDVDEEGEEEESYSEPASSDGGSSSCCCCCWSWWWWWPRLMWPRWLSCCMDSSEEPRNVECGIASGGNGMTSRYS